MEEGATAGAMEAAGIIMAGIMAAIMAATIGVSIQAMAMASVD